MLKIYLVSVLPVQPSFFFLFQPFLFSFSTSLLLVQRHTFLVLFSFLVSAPFSAFVQCSFLLSLAPHFFFSVDVLPFFFPAQNVFASTQNLFQFSPKPFFQPKMFLLQPKTFFSAQNVFQPKILFQPVCGSAPPSFLLLQRHFSFF